MIHSNPVSFWVWQRKHWPGTQEPRFLVSAQPPVAGPLPEPVRIDQMLDIL